MRVSGLSVPELDAYTWRARIFPVILVISPAVVFMATTAIAEVKLPFGGATLGALLALVAAQLGRDRGRRLQPEPLEEWGGAPTVRLLQFRSGQPAERVRRDHETVSEATRHALPSAEQEAADPQAADRAYEDALAVLRELTRNTDAYRLVFSENADYGFRRNTLGLRPFGIASAGIVLAGSVLLFVASEDATAERLVGAGPPAIWALALLVFFHVVVRPAWVRVPAEAYAERLLRAAELVRRDGGGESANPSVSGNRRQVGMGFVARETTVECLKAFSGAHLAWLFSNAPVATVQQSAPSWRVDGSSGLFTVFCGLGEEPAA